MLELLSVTDRKVITSAQNWLGTPYRHQGHQKQIGCDCLGFIRGVWRDIYDQEPEKPAPYAMDWAEHSDQERMLDAAHRHLGQDIPISQMHAGCLILFRWRETSAIKHAGILTNAHQFIHAYERVGVTQSALVPSWRRRIAAVFEFPS